MNTKKAIICASIIASLSSVSQSAQADIIDFQWNGLLTLLDPVGNPMANTSYPYYGDPTWGYGFRSQVSGTVSFNTNTGAGAATVNPFEFFSSYTVFHDFHIQSVSDGLGGVGNLVVGSMLLDWEGNNNINLGIVLDASGLFNALMSGVNVGDVISGGVMPASNSIKNGTLAIGPAVLATTTYNTEFHNDGVYISGGDTIGGSPVDNGPFTGYSINLDMVSMTVANITIVDPIPVPASVWLFGSGLLGLFGVMRKRATH